MKKHTANIARKNEWMKQLKWKFKDKEVKEKRNQSKNKNKGLSMQKK